VTDGLIIVNITVNNNCLSFTSWSCSLLLWDAESLRELDDNQYSGTSCLKEKYRKNNL